MTYHGWAMASGYAYRVNFNQGQIQRVASKAEGIRYLNEIVKVDCPTAFLERYEAGSADDPGEWVRVKVKVS